MDNNDEYYKKELVLVDKKLWDELQSYKDSQEHAEELEDNSTIFKEKLDKVSRSFNEKIDQLELSLKITKRSLANAYDELRKMLRRMELHECETFGRRACRRCLAYGRIAIENSPHYKLCEVCMGRGYY